MRYAILILTFLTVSASAQRKMSTAEYVDTYKNIAIEKMNTYRIPASITLAQGLLESGNGGSELAVSANNHFGIKCGKSWTGPRVLHDDDAKDDCFRKYSSVEESFRDHSIFLSEGKRYASLFELKTNDYEGWARGLKAAGYATNPMYADMLINLINRYKLYQYDVPQVMGGVFGSKIFVGEGNAPTPLVRVGLTWGRCNGVRYVVAREGDTYQSLARKLRIPIERLLKFNDLHQTIPIDEGTRIFIQRKGNSNKFQNAHVVRKGETSYSISQDFGVKLRSLKQMNRKLKKSPPVVGQQITLRK